LPRSTYYHAPQPESAENLRLLRELDELYLKYPFLGSRKLAAMLKANRKRMQRLMRILGIEALYPKPNLSRLPLQQAGIYRKSNMGSLPNRQCPLVGMFRAGGAGNSTFGGHRCRKRDPNRFELADL